MKTIITLVVIILIIGYSPPRSKEPYRFDFIGYFTKMKAVTK